MRTAVREPASAAHAGEAIRGTMSLNEIERATGVPKDYILKSIGAPAGTNARKPVREWIHGLGKSMQEVRQAVAEYRRN